MIKTFITVFGFLILSNFLLAQENLELKIKIENIENVKGELQICLSNNADDFLENCYASQIVKVQQEEMVVVFQNLPRGEYAVSLFHDEDENGTMNLEGFLGSPSEKYGFSNNPKIRFRSPKFSKCAFIIKSNTEIKVKLKG